MAATLRILIAVIFVLITTSGGIYASTHEFADTASDSIVPFLIIGEVTLLAEGKGPAVQGTKSLLYTGLETHLLKATVRAKRPNSDVRTSFPSGHTSAAFAMATVLADYKPKLAIPAYAVATTIGWSRVEVNDHTWADVIAGAALGYFTAKHFTKSHLSVSPDGVDYDWKW